MPSVPPGELNAALRSRFPELNEDVYLEAENLCTDVELSASDLFIKWEVFAMRNKLGDTPTVADLRALRADILRENKSNSNKPTVKSEPRMSYTSAIQPPPVISSVNDFFAYADELLPGATAEDDDDNTAAMDMSLEDDGEFPVRPAKRESKLSPGTKSKMEIGGDGASSKPSERILFGHDDDTGTDETTFIRSAKLFNDPSGIKLPGDDSTDSRFAQRQGVGKVECTFGDDEISKSDGKYNKDNMKISVSIHEQYIIGDANRYMNDEMRSKVEAVRNHVRELGSRLIERATSTLPDGAELPPSPPDVFTTPSSDTVMAIGRIRVELGESDGSVVGRINEKSVVLESEDGHWLRLNLERVKENKKPLFLHPGMVVAVEGVNTNGRVFDVSEIHDNAIPVVEGGPIFVKKVEDAKEEKIPAASGDVDDDADMDMGENGEEQEKNKNAAPIVHVLVAGGPYTTMTNLKYEPLDELAAVIKTSKPDVVLLTGPFLDGTHPLVNEQLPASFETVFEGRVLRRIAKMAGDNQGTSFVIQPSLNDIHHDFVVPQPPYYLHREKEVFGLPPNVTFVSNPAVVRLTPSTTTINTTYKDVCVGMSSLPTISDISGDCLCWNSPTDRFGAIVGHMLKQTSFYPTNPPAPNVPVDSTLAYEKVSMPPGDDGTGIGIDVLITPNKLKQFIKVAPENNNNTLVVNPGSLTRGVVGGSYAEIFIPLTQKDAQRNNNNNKKKKSGRATETNKCYANVLKL